jgi:hypothetical protein
MTVGRRDTSWVKFVVCGLVLSLTIVGGALLVDAGAFERRPDNVRYYGPGEVIDAGHVSFRWSAAYYYPASADTWNVMFVGEVKNAHPYAVNPLGVQGDAIEFPGLDGVWVYSFGSVVGVDPASGALTARTNVPPIDEWFDFAVAFESPLDPSALDEIKVILWDMELAEEDLFGLSPARNVYYQALSATMHVVKVPLLPLPDD